MSMNQRAGKVMGLCSLGAALLLGGGLEAKQPRSPGRLTVFSGRITNLLPEVKALEVTREDALISMNFTLSLATELRERGRPILFQDLKQGDPVRVYYYNNSLVQRVERLAPRPRPVRK
jgi:hypothetical protein